MWQSAYDESVWWQQMLCFLSHIATMVVKEPTDLRYGADAQC